MRACSRRRRIRLFPVGRLDADSSGLILMTNDGELANRLTHPSYGVTKDYVIVVRGRIEEQDIERLRINLRQTHAGPRGRRPQAGKPQVQASPAGGDAVGQARAESVRIISRTHDRTAGDRTTLRFTLKEGQNREIRGLLARHGLNVRRLQLVGIGPLSLKGLSSGRWRFMNPSEVRSLKRAVGLM